jgi:phosphatidylglycerophosphate synthase
MGTIARYTEPSPMSIRLTPLPSCSLALMREAHLAFARSLGLAAAATLLLVLGGVVRTLPGMAGLTLFVGLVVAVERLLAGHHPYPRLGAANRITLARAGVACLIASRALDPATLGTAEQWMVVALAGGALLLDGTDGWAARRQGLSSAFGARFDMEIDAFAIAVLTIMVVKAAAVPCWVLAIGAMRYLYLGAGRILPILRQPPAPRAFADRRRKTIAVVQSLALLYSLVPLTPPRWAATACALALCLLVYSFAADIVIQTWNRNARVAPEQVAGAAAGAPYDGPRQGEESASIH